VHKREGKPVPILITIRGEVQTKNNFCRVTRRNGDILGVFGPNEMCVYQDNPYDPQPYKTRFKPEGGSIKDWTNFKAQMKRMNGRVVADTHMPTYLREEAHFLNVE
jgi:hypothetical protein